MINPLCSLRTCGACGCISVDRVPRARRAGTPIPWTSGDDIAGEGQGLRSFGLDSPSSDVDMMASAPTDPLFSS